MGKDLDITILFDFYGNMLNDKQNEIMDYYYNEDLSLAEIAEHIGITRQGVRDNIKRAEGQLLNFEDKLGLVARFGLISSKVSDIDNSILELLPQIPKELALEVGKLKAKIDEVIELL